MYKHLIFDFDGTLADTTKGILDTNRATLQKMGLPVPTDEFLRGGIGLALTDGFKRTVPGASDEEIQTLCSVYRETWKTTGTPATVAFPGVVDTLQSFKDKGYKMYVATSRSHDSLELLAQKIGVIDFFEGMYGAEDVVNHKPAPDTVNLIVEKYGLDRAECLVIGDAHYDILMGQGAGCHTCGISWGNQSREQLSTVNPTYLIDNIQELAEILLRQ